MAGVKVFYRNPDVLSRAIGEETVLVPVRSNIVDVGCLFTVNDTGAFVWMQLEKPRTIEQISEALAEEFEVSIEQAREDVGRFVSQLAGEKCVLEGEEEGAVSCGTR